MRLALWNLAVYSAQLAVLVSAAVLAARLLPLRVPRLLLSYWQLLMAAAVLLPFVQPWPASPPTSALWSALAIGDGVDAAAAPVPSIDWWTVAAAMVIGGIAFRIGRLALGAWRLRSMVRRATPAADLAPGAEVLLTDEIDSPATIGWRRPRILLPPRALALSPSAREAIIAHELMHIERGDWLVTLAEEVWCALLWFHPLARVLSARLSLARETVVDDLTIRRTRNRRAYAEALLAFADPQPHVVGATPFIGHRTLRQRISFIAQEVPMSVRRATSYLAGSVAMVGFTVAVAVFQVPLSSRLYAQVEVAKPGNGVTLPTVVVEVKPVYTAEAKEKKIQGSVWMSVVVQADGDVGDVSVTRSLDDTYGLDQQAVIAAKQWKFRPGMKDGKAVPVQVTIEMTFTLK